MRETTRYPVIVCGHICLDIIPAMQAGFQMMPGKLLEVGKATLASGGAVANTGLAMHRLGMPAKLMGKIGEDRVGEAILSIIRAQGEALSEGMIMAAGESSSYTIVISPPDVDRMFLHCTGANDTFRADDVSMEALNGAGLFHFGYPPLMRGMFEQGGAELALLLNRAKKAGATTSLDMAKPDPDSAAGQIDWRALLQHTLPHVDFFLPSIEELLYMLRRDLYESMVEKSGRGSLIGHVDGSLLSELSSELIALGAAVVVLKLGEFGLYMRTASDASRLSDTGRYRPLDCESWLGRELFVPCFEVSVAGTTGAGDCTIAGFLTGMIKGLSPEQALLGGVAVGACNVERQDAVSGIPPWTKVMSRIEAGWRQHALQLQLPNYRRVLNASNYIYAGPSDAGRGA